MEWDLIITDEAHEGIKTKLAIEMQENLKSKYWLYLSGAPFNIASDFDEKDIFSYDYIAERRNYNKWEKLVKVGKADKNPYAHLPQMNIYAYDIDKVFDKFNDIDAKAFKFNEFFKEKVDQNGRGMNKFEYQSDVDELLALMSYGKPETEIVIIHLMNKMLINSVIHCGFYRPLKVLVYWKKC
jgi:type II restriction enzyme